MTTMLCIGSLQEVSIYHVHMLILNGLAGHHEE